jgi:dGTPase
MLTASQPDTAAELELDPDVAEAAGLAHDLGHPPFGHIAEEMLNAVVRDAQPHGDEGYEGNAQSFRIVTALSVSDAAPRDQEFVAGLNLTRATLNGLLKYPYLQDGTGNTREKWGSYKTEQDVFEWTRGGAHHDAGVLRRRLWIGRTTSPTPFTT